MTATPDTNDDYDEAPPNLGDVRVALRRYANALSVTADESEWTNTKVEMSPQDARELADTLFHALVFLFQTDAESKNR
jgi:hypothetical protein